MQQIEWKIYINLRLNSQFLFELNAKIIVEEPNCSKNLTIASRTDIAITNSSSSFQELCH